MEDTHKIFLEEEAIHKIVVRVAAATKDAVEAAVGAVAEDIPKIIRKHIKDKVSRRLLPALLLIEEVAVGASQIEVVVVDHPLIEEDMLILRQKTRRQCKLDNFLLYTQNM